MIVIQHSGIFSCDNTLEKETDSSADLATAGHAGHFMHYYYTCIMRQNSSNMSQQDCSKTLNFLFRKLKCSVLRTLNFANLEVLLLLLM